MPPDAMRFEDSQSVLRKKRLADQRAKFGSPAQRELRMAWARANDQLVEYADHEEGLGAFDSAKRIRGIRTRLERAVKGMLP